MTHIRALQECMEICREAPHSLNSSKCTFLIAHGKLIEYI